jgi:hypothetical protein
VCEPARTLTGLPRLPGVEVLHGPAP